MKKMLAMLAIAVMSVALTTQPAAAAAQTFQNDVTHDCLDDSGLGLRRVVCNGLVYQQWNVKVWGDGTRELRNASTGLCIEQFGTHGEVRHATCNASTAQSWFVEHVARGIWFRNQQTGAYLMPGGSVQSFALIACVCNFPEYYNSKTWA